MRTKTETNTLDEYNAHSWKKIILGHLTGGITGDTEDTAELH